jgi:hypothetical protein
MDRRKIISISLVLTALMVVWVVVTVYQKNLYPASFTLITIPGDAKTTLDYKGIGANGTTHLKPGSYILRSTRSGFADNQQTVIVYKGGHQTINNILGPNSAIGTTWLKNNPDQQLRAESLTSKAVNTAGNLLTAENPLVQHLPFYTSGYHIDYGKDPAGNASIQITAATAAGRQVAIAQIRSWGYDPTDYNITFTSFTNVFGQGAKQ